ncbi:uncharacterized protein MYCFIDRAFT_185295 [Pseudocercospora fijiensis CIRAD86]|uniref:Quinate transporter n=1 Tax=Pseudocercospora fijiensis (strain CIRAD86) TaxID=383855 RepID=N1QBW6_PSEFD|nr:uncharacterized protein MYCFIDRAFT_185295 [Pseudocercospora fijiensis CIRAD86]EME88733.1 hypothetical protein MYCFIDRAFT_185295 [Pseudocercospora fijiensis CIRAD86]
MPSPNPPPPPPPEIYNVRTYSIAVIASTGAFLFGYDLAFIGTTITLESFRRDFNLLNSSPNTLASFAANIVSLLQAGCFFGSLLAGHFADRYGRKSSLMFAGMLFCLGSLMQTVAHGSWGVVFTGRAVGGLGVGAASMLVPLYVAELSPAEMRGRLVGVYEICVQLGTCLGFWVVYAVKKTMGDGSSQWITPFAIQLIPGGLLVVGMFVVPESPRWVAQHFGRSEALKVLSRLRKLDAEHEYVQDEVSRIVQQLEDEQCSGAPQSPLQQLKRLGRPGYRNRLVIGVWIFIFMQMAGSNAINYFSPAIFKSIGLKGEDTGLYATGIYGVVRLVAIVIAINFVVDRFGRRKMLMGGAAVMAIAMWYIGAYEKLVPDTPGGIPPAGYAAIVMIYVFSLGFCFSYAGVPWIYASEIYSMDVRSTAIAICIATHWLMNFVIARSVPYMITNIKYGTFFVFASCITVSIVFVYLCVPETKGLNLEEMDILFGSMPGEKAQ